VAEFSAAGADIRGERDAVSQAVGVLGERALAEVEGVLVERAAGALDRAAAVGKTVLGGVGGAPAGGGGDAGGAGGSAGGGGAGTSR
jgi:hypothetical protein